MCRHPLRSFHSPCYYSMKCQFYDIVDVDGADVDDAVVAIGFVDSGKSWKYLSIGK